MRVVGGALRGRRIDGPADDGGFARLRPTSDRMREAIFNIIAHGDYPDLDGARVLDLFAGTGAMGIEALSRGAMAAVFVDSGREARALLGRNIETMKLTDRARIVTGDAAGFRGAGGPPFDMVFCDAPYDRGLTRPALDAIVQGGILAPDAVLVVETGAEEALDLPPGLDLADERRYGAGKIRILRVAEPAPNDT